MPARQLRDADVLKLVAEAKKYAAEGKSKTAVLILTQLSKMDDRCGEATEQLMTDVIATPHGAEAAMTAVADILEGYGNSPKVTGQLGSVLLEACNKGENEERLALAVQCLEHSTAGRPLAVRGWAALDSARSLCFNRYHFAMLNDVERNRCFRTALHSCLADLRNGAPKEEALHVLDIGTGTGLLARYALEVDDSICVTAFEGCAALAEIAAEVLKADPRVQLVRQLSTEVAVLPAAHLVVTETLDCAAYGEGIVESVTDAARKIQRPFVVLPQKVSLVGCLVEHRGLAADFRVDRSAATIGRAVICARVAGRGAMNEVHKDGGSGLVEPYVAERAGKLTEKVRCLSSVECISTLTFPGGVPDPVVLNPRFRVSDAGTACAVMAWMNVQVFGDVSFTTSPYRAEASCWEQAFFPLPVLTPCRDGDIVPADFVLDDTIVLRNCTVPPDSCEVEFIFSRDEVRRLNDTHLWHHVYSIMGNALAAFESSDPAGNIVVVDGTGATWWPSLLIAHGVPPESIYLSHNASAPLDAPELSPLCGPHNSPDPLVAWATECCTLSQPPEATRHLAVPLFCSGVVQPCGMLEHPALERLRLHIKKGHATLPHDVKLFLIGVESDELVRETRVSEGNTLGVSVAGLINRYSSSVVSDINVHTLQHRRLTDPFGGVSLMRDDLNSTFHVPVCSPGHLHAFIFFFAFNFTADPTEVPLTTLDPACHFSSAAEVLPHPVPVVTGQQLRLSVVVGSGIIKVDLKAEEKGGCSR